MAQQPRKHVSVLGIPASAHDEQSARAYLERLRWPHGPVCHHCGSVESTPLKARQGSKNGVREGVYKCRGCRKQFSVTTGTIFERSHIPLHKWLMATHFLCASKKGMSAHQLHRLLGITYKTAWFMAHRLREAMKQPPLVDRLKGTVEVDETYVGGKWTRKRPNRGKEHKAPVLALVERGGRVRSHPMKRVTVGAIRASLLANVSSTARLMTDEHKIYKKVGQPFQGGHQRVHHAIGEYVRGEASTNTVESFFALLKRGIVGTFHHVSPQHLNRYCAEFEHRWNHRKVSDGERAVAMLQQIEGKRLLYKVPTQGIEKQG